MLCNEGGDFSQFCDENYRSKWEIIINKIELNSKDEHFENKIELINVKFVLIRYWII